MKENKASLELSDYYLCCYISLFKVYIVFFIKISPLMRMVARYNDFCQRFSGDEQRVLYARLTPDIAHRRILLLYPVVSYNN
uniref:Uncharacterized protein n=1 Tax=Heterorhabditis bacteriophora TaxID=37862 RepID=A0A1I7WKG9_HETBA